jgi:RNA polymerase sigma-70 factor (ECF subfamily)
MVSAAITALSLAGAALPGVDGMRDAMTTPAGAQGRASAPAGESRMEALLRAVAALRDRAAFAELFQHFAPRLKAFMMKGGADGDTAEELAQEAMIQVWRRADSFDPSRAAASTWIYTIARNKRIDRLRRERRPPMGEEEYVAAVGAAEGGPERGDQAAERSQAEARLARSLESLPEDQATVVKMAFYEDKSHSAIAAELHLPLGTVKSRIRLALTRLRGMIQDLDK